MEHVETVPARHARVGPRETTPVEDVKGPRAWVPSIAVLCALVIGGIFAYTLPAVHLEGGENLELSAVGDKLVRSGNGWLVTMSWFGAIVAALAAVSFPRAERFIQSITISAGSLAAMSTSIYVVTHLSVADENASSLGSGLILAWISFGIAAVIPWLALRWVPDRHPLGQGWWKWLFLLPAVIWVFLLTVFPLIYAFSTSRYDFRYGLVSRFVGWENYRALFTITDPTAAFLGALIVAATAAVAVMVGGALLTRLLAGEVTREDLRRIAHYIPVVTIPAVVVYLAGEILADPLDGQMTITFIFVAGAVVTEMILGFLIALLMNRELRARGVLRAVMTLPLFATPVALGYLARAIFFEQGGPINAGLSTLGLPRVPWLSDPAWARVATIIVDVWQWTPFVFIIALAGLQSLPQDVMEASEVDGASGWQGFVYVTMPLMAPILWLIFLLRAIDAFKVFDVALGLTLGGPGRSTEYYSLFNYRTARQFFNYGDAAAQAFLLLFVVMLLVALLWGRIRHVYDEEGQVT
jgi:multiple sugar transport system permease protein